MGRERRKGYLPFSSPASDALRFRRLGRRGLEDPMGYDMDADEDALKAELIVTLPAQIRKRSGLYGLLTFDESTTVQASITC